MVKRYYSLVVTIFCFVLLFGLGFAYSEVGTQGKALIVLKEDSYAELQKTRAFVESFGVHTESIFPNHVMITDASKELESKLLENSNIEAIYFTPFDADSLNKYGMPALIAGNAFNKSFEVEPVIVPENATPLINDVASREKVEAGIPQRSGLETDAYGAGTYEVSDFLLGNIVVSIILPESNEAIDPSTEDWNPTLIQNVQDGIYAGLTWLHDRRSAGAEFTWIYKFENGNGVVPTSYEPIIHPGQLSDEELWVKQLMSNLGYSGADSKEAVLAYENALRQQYGSDWATVIFVVNSYNDTDGMFLGPPYSFAYVYGYWGPYEVMTYDNDGYGIIWMKAITAHETIHLFGAPDQMNQTCSCLPYADERRGYLGVQNRNCERYGRGFCGEDQECIMRDAVITAYNDHAMSASTREALGWRDSDLDGIMDIEDTFSLAGIDTPASSNFYGTPSNSIYRSGFGEVNKYPRGSTTTPPFYHTNNISINEIIGVQYNLNDGAWADTIPKDGIFDSNKEYCYFIKDLAGLSEGPQTFKIKSKDNKLNETQSPYPSLSFNFYDTSNLHSCSTNAYCNSNICYNEKNSSNKFCSPSTTQCVDDGIAYSSQGEFSSNVVSGAEDTWRCNNGYWAKDPFTLGSNKPTFSEISFTGSGSNSATSINILAETNVSTASLMVSGKAQPGNWAENGALISGISSLSSYNAVAVGDLDNDGDLDAVFGKSDGGLIGFRNTGTIFSPSWARDDLLVAGFSSNGRTYSVPFLVDLDNDGDKDMVVGFADGTVIGYRNDGSKKVPHWTQDLSLANISNGFTYAKPTLGDIDNDGDFDLFIGDNATGKVFAYINEGTASAPIFVRHTEYENGLPTLGSGSQPAVELADLDFDGDLDLITITVSKTVYSYKNNGVPSTAWVSDSSLLPGFGLGNCGTSNPIIPRKADLKSDGIPALLVSCNNGGNVVKGFERAKIYPSNVSIKLGTSGTTIFGPSTLNETPQNVSFASQLQATADTCTCSGCTYTDGICKVPLVVSTESAGKVVLSNLNIVHSAFIPKVCTQNSNCLSQKCRTSYSSSTKYCANTSTACVDSAVQYPSNGLFLVDYLQRGSTPTPRCYNSHWAQDPFANPLTKSTYEQLTLIGAAPNSTAKIKIVPAHVIDWAKVKLSGSYYLGPEELKGSFYGDIDQPPYWDSSQGKWASCIGEEFVPTFNYTLTKAYLNYLYQKFPGYPSLTFNTLYVIDRQNSNAPLAQATFSARTQGQSGGTLNTPINLQAGHVYAIASCLPNQSPWPGLGCRGQDIGWHSTPNTVYGFTINGLDGGYPPYYTTPKCAYELFGTVAGNPSNVSVDVGGTGSNDCYFAGTLNESASPVACDFTSKLSSILSSNCTCPLCSWSSTYCVIPLKVNSASVGYITLDNLDVNYHRPPLNTVPKEPVRMTIQPDNS